MPVKPFLKNLGISRPDSFATRRGKGLEFLPPPDSIIDAVVVTALHRNGRHISITFDDLVSSH